MVWSPIPSPDITTAPTGKLALAGLSPARSSTSFTALFTWESAAAILSFWRSAKIHHCRYQIGAKASVVGARGYRSPGFGTPGANPRAVRTGDLGHTG